MIEIIVVILLCSTNSKNAKARGKSSGAAVGYTIGLWFGGEILGALIGVAASGGEVTPPVYIAALLLAAGGGVASYFIAKAGTVVAQGQPFPYNASALRDPVYSVQQPQPAYASQHARPVYANQYDQPAPPSPNQQPVPLPQPQAQSLQSQPQPPQPQGQPQPQPQPQYQPQPQRQAATATLIFSAKKVMGQFLVSSVTIEVNGASYQTGFNQPLTIQAPAGNTQIVCYLNYMGKSGVAQMQAVFAPQQTYRLEYKSPLVVTSSGTLKMT